MKKILLFLSLNLLFSSCSKDDSILDEKNTSPQISINISSDEIGVNQFINYSIKATDIEDGDYVNTYVYDNYGWKDIKKEGKYRPKEIGKSILTFVAIDIDGDSTKVTKEINVKPCDFFFGRWGDTREDLLAFEDGGILSNSESSWLYFIGGNTFGQNNRTYGFSPTILERGETWFSFQCDLDAYSDNKVLSSLTNWETSLQELTKEFGNPISNTMPNTQNWSNSDKLDYAYNLIFGKSAVFRNDRTQVVLWCENYKDKTKDYGYTLRRRYTRVE